MALERLAAAHRALRLFTQYRTDADALAKALAVDRDAAVEVTIALGRENELLRVAERFREIA
jgi:hypothetical protein